MDKIIKYKWYILSYILYISVVFVCISDFRKNEFWNALLIFDIIIPILVYMAYSLLKYRKEKQLWPFSPTQADILIDKRMTAESEKGIDLDKSTLKEQEDTNDVVFKPNAFAEAWSFGDFIKMFGPKVGLASHINKRTGTEFHTCEISNSEGRTLSIRFDSSLGELNASQFKERKNELWIGRRKDNGCFYLYDINFRDWSDVDF